MPAGSPLQIACVDANHFPVLLFFVASEQGQFLHARVVEGLAVVETVRVHRALSVYLLQ